MEYSQVMLEMLERIKVLENKVKVLEEKIANTPTPKPQTAMQLDKVSAKYRGLAEYLLSTNETRVTLSYSQIEEILGVCLAPIPRESSSNHIGQIRKHTLTLRVGWLWAIKHA